MIDNAHFVYYYDHIAAQDADFIQIHITTKVKCRVYRIRWLILFLFVLYSMANGMQWIQYSIIADVVTKYYSVSNFAVDLTSVIYMFTYIILIFPGSWALDKLGLRKAVLLGAFGTCFGSIVKLFSVHPTLFYVTFIGQTIVAISQVFILSVPARLAAVWFGPSEVSLACSIGVFGNQVGIAAGFLFPPTIVAPSENPDVVGARLQLMFNIVAAFTGILLVLLLIFFKDAPELPPSPAQAAQRACEPSGFGSSIKRLFMNPAYVLLLFSYGINVGVFYAISTLLNDVILGYFPGRQQDAGQIGLVIVIAGMVGSILCGIILDRTHKFKETTLVLYFLSLAGMILFTFTLGSGYLEVVYFTSGVVGFFMTGYLPVGFEFATELTYPEPEGTSSGMLNASAQIFGIAFTMFARLILNTFGDLWSNLSLCAALVVGAGMTTIIKCDLRRQTEQVKNLPRPAV
ncbi:choline/ethanolamine transporter flvcr2b isoform X2 [Bemisia tabaci]|uniref:choline/ethanolamine transporter flvcr2b isoform X2 n=1 Tax=Bemisia tabaci TaxID=7038 RepID=UPI0008F99811|nr:PREDICTED: feline leukemia virus subgroup C receptor-related protein 2 isoform X2 [Bemisia tabaci]XP_018912636.1 PREDICTED: feline leukemia virus subgroup C receptor-related protein 2 isoform X2 [Bemisia tabaci]